MSSKLKHNCVTEFSSYSFTYEWKISNVNSRLNKPQPLQCPETIKSPPGKLPATEWRLEALGEKVYNGSGVNQPPNSWTVKVILINPAQVWARVLFQTKARHCTMVGLYDSSDMSDKYSEITLIVSPQCSAPRTVKTYHCGPHFTGFIPFTNYGGDARDSITNNYLYYQDLILSCDITVTELESPVHATRTTVAETLKVPSFDLSMVMDDARQRDRYTDVIVVTKEKEFKAHKVVLACQSPFFETCLEERWKKQGDSNRIEMLDVSTDTMDAILTYMYTGKVKDIDKAAFTLLSKANEYQLEGLKMKCEETLSKTLTAQTVIDVLLLANTHNANNLKQLCLAFITANVSDVKKSSPWKELKAEGNKDLWMEVLEHIVEPL